MNTVKYIKICEGAVAPTYGTASSAGADLYACNGGTTIIIEPGKMAMIHTGICLQIPEGYAGMIFARSGISVKRGLAPANKVGVIDSDYRGEIMVPLYNHSQTTQTVEEGERIAQIVIMPYLIANFIEADNLDDTQRATGGFGSTGTK